MSRDRLNYIVVEVREPEKAPHYSTDAGRLRSVIHDAIEDIGVDATTMLVRHDRERTFYGTPQYWNEIHDLFVQIRAEIERRKLFLKMRRRRA